MRPLRRNLTRTRTDIRVHTYLANLVDQAAPLLAVIGVVLAGVGETAPGALLVGLAGVFYHKADDMYATADQWAQQLEEDGGPDS